MHSFNVSAADFDTMLQRCEIIRNSGMEPGSYAFLIDGTTAGWMAVQTLRRHYPDVFIHFHRAGHGAYTRPPSKLNNENQSQVPWLTIGCYDCLFHQSRSP